MSTKLFHSLAGKDIYFKALSTNDTQEIHKYASDKEVARFIGWNLMNTLEETREHIATMIGREAAGTHLYASIVLKSTQAVIGTAMMFNFNAKASHAELGYVLHKEQWGKGYGTESVALMTGFSLTVLKIHKLQAGVVDANIGSVRILEKNGYELEGRLRDHYFIDGDYYDALLFGKILR